MAKLIKVLKSTTFGKEINGIVRYATTLKFSPFAEMDECEEFARCFGFNDQNSEYTLNVNLDAWALAQKEWAQYIKAGESNTFVIQSDKVDDIFNEYVKKCQSMNWDKMNCHDIHVRECGISINGKLLIGVKISGYNDMYTYHIACIGSKEDARVFVSNQLAKRLGTIYTPIFEEVREDESTDTGDTI